MKKMILFGLMLMLSLSAVSAFSYKDFYNNVGFQTQSKQQEKQQEQIQNQTCDGALLFTNELALYSSKQAFIDAVNVFDDGYHVLELTKTAYQNTNWITVYKSEGQIIWVKKGVCAEGAVKMYSTTLDIQQVMDSGRKMTFGATMSTISKVKGISTMQKFQLARIAFRNHFRNENQIANQKGPGAPNQNITAPGPGAKNGQDN